LPDPYAPCATLVVEVMSASPYRTPAERTNEAGPTERVGDTELVPFFLILWIASVARVLLGIAHSEVFGAEATLATLAMFFLPLLAKDGVLALLRRRPAEDERETRP
jgi:hypothetical protein